MDTLATQFTNSDQSSCSDSTGPTTPSHSPLLRSVSIKGIGEVPLHQIFNLARCSRTSGLSTPTTSSEACEDLRAREIHNVCFIGAGYVGGPTAAIIALFNPNIRVEVVDRDVGRINRWKSSHLPIHEPRLDEVVRISRDGAQVTSHWPLDESGNTQSGVAWQRIPNLFFSTEVSDSISRADIIFLAVNTSTKTFGIGAGKATDMSACDSATKEIARHARKDTIIVEKSTVPCGTAKRIRSMLHSLRPDVLFEVLSNPEFLAEGSAIENLMKPDRVIIGSLNTVAGRIAADQLANLYRAWIPESRILTTNIWSSELSKLVANAMLAQRISSINSISAICEETGADVEEIARSVGLDSRIGPKFLKAGLGFGGSCFRKDIASLTYLAESLGLEDVAEYWNQVNIMNESQRMRFGRNVIRRLDENLVGKKITILGFAFKANTGDARESLAMEVIRSLLVERPTEIAIYDPYCKRFDILRELQVVFDATNSAIEVYEDAYLACFNSDAILIVTDCDKFRMVDETTSQSPLQVIRPEPAVHRDTQSSMHFSTSQLGINLSYKLQSPPKCIPDTDNSRCSECMTDIKNCLDQTTPYQPLNWPRIFADMNKPRWIFDGRNVLDAKVVEASQMDVRIETIGKRSRYRD